MWQIRCSIHLLTVVAAKYPIQLYRSYYLYLTKWRTLSTGLQSHTYIFMFKYINFHIHSFSKKNKSSIWIRFFCIEIITCMNIHSIDVFVCICSWCCDFWLWRSWMWMKADKRKRKNERRNKRKEHWTLKTIKKFSLAFSLYLFTYWGCQLKISYEIRCKVILLPQKDKKCNKFKIFIAN